MTGSADKNFRLVFQLLERNGLMLLSGIEIPDVCGVVCTARPKGSWWSAPEAQEIFNIAEALSDHPEITVTKLVSRKVTFVHRKLWRELVAVGKAREEWQLTKISASAKRLLNQLDKEGTLATNSLGRTIGPKPGDAARELELKLLAHADQIHTDSGKHAKVLETWDAWARRMSYKPRPLSPETARRVFENRLNEIIPKGHSQLPWS